MTGDGDDVSSSHDRCDLQEAKREEDKRGKMILRCMDCIQKLLLLANASYTLLCLNKLLTSMDITYKH